MLYVTKNGKITRKPEVKKYVNACYTCSGCYSCMYSDECSAWKTDFQDTSAIPQVEVEKVTASMSLCLGRHAIPEAVDGAIYPTEVNPLEVGELESQAMRVLSAMHIAYLNLYVTGLTVALIAVLNVCHEMGIHVTLYHYDRESGKYYAQEVK
jgi:hypothetical protein|nr:MAG TPA: hypothetical protein [Caudoviricetes sp.]